jgi:hypothetical protein
VQKRAFLEYHHVVPFATDGNRVALAEANAAGRSGIFVYLIDRGVKNER